MSTSVRQEADSSEQDYGEFMAIEKLQDLGINRSDIDKMVAAGIKTVGYVLNHPAKELEQIRGFSEAKVQKVIEQAKKLLQAGFVTGNECLKDREHILKISSGSQQLNEMIGGGFQSKSITELHGEFRTGKTQLCHTLCVTTQMPKDQGGAEGKVCYIDTEGTFRPERVKEIAINFGFEPDMILDNVFFQRVNTSDEQISCLNEIVALITSGEPIKLVIVDSLMALFRTEYRGRGELSIRQQKIAGHLRDLQRISDEFNIPVIVTNQMSADPGAMI